MAVAAGPRRRLLRLAYGLRRGGLVEQPGIRHPRGRRVEVEAPAEAAYNVDGEVVRAGPATFTIDPAPFDLVVG